MLVLEKETIGSAASGAAAGLIAPCVPFAAPQSFLDLLQVSFRALPALIAELEGISGIGVQFERRGTLRVALTQKQAATLQKQVERWRSWGFQSSWQDDLRELEPALAPTFGAVMTPEEAHLDAPHFVQACAQAGMQKGVHFRSQQAVVDLHSDRSKVIGVTTAQGETIACDHVVFATGAWSSQWEKLLHLSLPVTPSRGQLLELKSPITLKHIVFGNGIYLIPKSNGTVLVGATKEHAGFDVQVTAEGRTWLKEKAEQLLPHLSDGEVHATWAGLRPKTPDGRPILGAAPSWDNVTIATGHNAFGMTLSAITGSAIAEGIITGSMPDILLPFAPQIRRSSSSLGQK